jgi:pilus assembly protein CpaB
LKRRIFTVVLAVLLAAVGTVGVLAYVHQADSRAVAGQRATTVLVAGSAIPAGTSASTALQNGSLTTQTFPAASVPADAVRSITPDLASLVLSTEIQPGQMLVRPMLVTAAQVAGTALAIPKGKVAVTVALCMPESVAGYVHSGSEVAVFDSYASQLTVSDCNGAPTHTVKGKVHTRMVLPKVEVLAVGTAAANAQATASTGSGGLAQDSTNSTNNSAVTGQGAVLVTFAVDQADAERLIMLNEGGFPYLALLTSTSSTAFDLTPSVALFRP